MIYNISFSFIHGNITSQHITILIVTINNSFGTDINVGPKI